ncbi:MAG: ComEC/Rec2 family competence protein, partial [Pseudomonadota bacterium]
PVRAIAAIAGILGAAAYLVISGMSPATLRAFVMLTMAMLALLVGRRALTLRNVALAAIALLICAPHLVLEPGFQMSFAAVTALIAVAEWGDRRARLLQAIRTAREMPTPGQLPPQLDPRYAPTIGVLDVVRMALERTRSTGLARRVATGLALTVAGLQAVLGTGKRVIITTVIATVAVAPLTLFHFNALALYGVAANVLVVPLVTMLGMPLALTGLLAMPLGLEAAPLAGFGQIIDVVLDVARTVAGWPGAVITAPALVPWAVGVTMLGLTWLLVWRTTKLRALGLALVAVGLGFAGTSQPPAILVAQDGKAFAVRQPDGSLRGPKSFNRNFAAKLWLKRDGEPRPLRAQFNGSGVRCDRLDCVTQYGPWLIARPRTVAALNEDCRRAQIVITPLQTDRPCRSAQLFLTGTDLAARGAVAVALPAIQRTSVGRDGLSAVRALSVQSDDPARSANLPVATNARETVNAVTSTLTWTRPAHRSDRVRRPWH